MVWATADLNGQRKPGKVASIKCAVCASDEDFRTRCSELDTKHLRVHHALGDESLEYRRRVKIRYRLESHAHQAIWHKVFVQKAQSIVRCSTQGLRLGLGAAPPAHPSQRHVMKRKAVLHTVRPAIPITSVYCSPMTLDPSA
jgi:hypothetical protein